MRNFISLLLLFASSMVVEAKMPRPRSLPRSTFECSPPIVQYPSKIAVYGELIQNKDSVLLVGNEWWGVGKVLPDGTLRLFWISQQDCCWGEYRLDEKGNMVGQYSYIKDCTVLENGRVFPLLHDHYMTTLGQHR